MFCKECGKEFKEEESNVCDICGTAKGVGSNYCAICGAPLAPDGLVCGNCGNPINEATYDNASSNTTYNDMADNTYNADNQNYNNQETNNEQLNMNKYSENPGLNMNKPSDNPELNMNKDYAQNQYNGEQYYNNGQYNNQQYGNGQYNNDQNYNNQSYNGQPYNGNAYNNGQGFYNNNGYVEQKSKVVAGLLGIFLGAFGVHNFYLGNSSRGLVQVLVSVIGGICTCGIATVVIEIWAFVEAIMILSGSINVDANGVPLRD